MNWYEGHERMKPYLRGNGIDVACGHIKAPEAVGIDIVPRGEEYHPGYTSVADLCFDAMDLPFRDGTLDFVFCSHGLEHMPSPRSALREWARVLKPGGHLCCIVPDVRYVYFDDPDAPGGRIYHGLEPDKIRPMLDNIGLDVLYYDTIRDNYVFDIVARRRRETV